MKHWVSTAIDFYNREKTYEAKKLFLKILRKIPNEPNALNYLSIIAFKANNLKEAQRYIETYLRNDPKSSLFLNRLGQIHLLSKEYEAAKDILAQAIEQKPNFPEANLNLGRVYLAQDDYIKATHALERVLELQPDHKVAQKLLNEIRQPSERKVGSEQYKRLVREGEHHLRGSRYEAALSVFQQLHGENPEDYIITFNLALVYFAMNMYSNAIPLFEHILNFNWEKKINALCYFMYSKISLSDFSDYKENVKILINETTDYVSKNSDFQIPVYILNYFEVPRMLISKAGWHQSELISSLYKVKLSSDSTAVKHSKIRLGYISTKFRASPGGVLFHKVFQHHNRDRFEVYGYSLSKPDDHDFFTRHFKTGFDVFRDVSSLADREAAMRINNDKIDILITLAGYADNMRMGILALQPAPIQINWEGYNESMGSIVHYSLLDETLTLNDPTEFYQEKVIELPGCAMFNSPIESSDTASKEEYGLPDNTFIYGCLNHPKKITPQEIEVWSTILKQNTDSVLWLFDGGNTIVRKNLISEFATRNISVDRILFTGNVSIQSHWNRLKLVDLFLDTFLVNAHTTAIESLRMGTPVLTLKGSTNYGMYGASILHAAGLDELVCNSEDEYVEKAVGLGNPSKIQALKSILQKNLSTEGLFDAEKNIRNLESKLMSLLNIKHL